MFKCLQIPQYFTKYLWNFCLFSESIYPWKITQVFYNNLPDFRGTVWLSPSDSADIFSLIFMPFSFSPFSFTAIPWDIPFAVKPWSIYQWFIQTANHQIATVRQKVDVTTNYGKLKLSFIFLVFLTKVGYKSELDTRI